MQLDRSLYLVRFFTKEDRDLALVKECLHFDNKPIVVQEWIADLDLSKNRAPQVQVWVRFPISLCNTRDVNL